ncbi:cytochrome P450 71A8-like [Apium graveolens]|uniref:cytochrome P450 71A8-like n=1 Tax=Apium graveolens TaxID=4045 RepID=UPI003D7A9C85
MGTDTTYTVLEWAMVELLRHPQVTKKVPNELRLIGRNQLDIIAQDDYEKIPYLKAVIKETLRIHPTLPLIVPREARNNVNIMGYDIVAGTMVLINAYAIGRETALWDEPDEFRPERFLNSSIDFRGHDFELELQMKRVVREQNSGSARLSELGSARFLKRADGEQKNKLG